VVFGQGERGIKNGGVLKPLPLLAVVYLPTLTHPTKVKSFWAGGYGKINDRMEEFKG